MPYLFTAEAKFEGGKYILYNPTDLISSFTFLEGNIIVGSFISTNRDGRTIRIGKDFKCKLSRSGNYIIGEILEPNPLKAMGLPLPSTLLIVAYKYQEEPVIQFGDEEEKRKEFPIAENVMLKGTSMYSYFEDEVKRILKEEEAGLILEGTIFHPQLQKHASNIKEALLSFEQENFAFTKTSCRKVLENIKRIANECALIDGSKSLSEKFSSFINSLYSFASIGGPHEGVTTREETELLLKTTTSVLFYVNSLLKNERIVKKDVGSP